MQELTKTYKISIHALCEEGDKSMYKVACSRKISIHALCEEGDSGDQSACDADVISIHALCEEGDQQRVGTRRLWVDFYPRPLRGGRRIACAMPEPEVLFLSTPSARRATQYAGDGLRRVNISIHALCEEGDP